MPSNQNENSGGRRIGLWVSLVLGLVLLAAVADSIVGTRTLVPQGKVLAAQLSDALGVPVEIEGGVRLRLFPQPRFEIMDLHVRNLPGRKSADMARIAFVDLELSLAALLKLSLEVERLTFRDVHLEVEADEDGAFELMANPRNLVDHDPLIPIDVHLETIRIENLRAYYRRGPDGEVTSFHLEEFELFAENEDARIEVNADGSLRGAAFHIVGDVGTVAEVFDAAKPFDVALRGTAFGSDWSVNGRISSNRRAPIIDVQVVINIPDLEALAGRTDPRLDAIGAVSIEGNIANPGQLLGVRDLLIRAESRVLSGRIAGKVGDLLELREIDLAVRLASDDVHLLEPLIERSIPDIEHFDLDVELSDASGLLGVHGSATAASEEGGISIEAKGRCDDLRSLQGIDVTIRVRGEDLPSLGEAFDFGIPLPAFAPVVATLVLNDADGDLGVSGQVELGLRDGTWAVLATDVDDLLGFQGVHAKIQFGAANFDAFRSYIGGRNFAPGPFSGEAEIDDEDGSLGLEHFEVTGGKENGLSLRLSGALDDLLELDEIAIEASFRAENLSRLGSLFGIELPPISPAEFSGTFVGSNERIESDGTLRLGESRFHGSWSGSVGTDQRPTIRAVIESEHVRLRDIGIEPTVVTAEIIEAATVARGRWWVGDEELPFAGLRILDADLRLEVGKVTGRTGFELSEATFVASLEDGELHLGPIHGQSVGGEVNAKLVLDGSLPTSESSLDFTATGVDLGNLLEQFDADVDYEGIVSADLHLTSRGDTLDQIRRSLDGTATFSTWGATFASEYGQKFLRDLGRVAIPDFNVDRAQQVSCLGGAFELKDGVATASFLLLESPEVTVLGSGAIDLGQRRYALRLVPRPRDPGLLSTAATVDVTGALDDPKFSPVATSIAATVATALFSNFKRLGGLMLTPILAKRAGEPDLCRTLLGPKPIRAIQQKKAMQAAISADSADSADGSPAVSADSSRE